MFNVEKHEDENGLTLSLSGRLDTSSSPELNTALQEEISKRKIIMLDVKDLEYLSSAGLRVMLVNQQAMVGKKGGLKVINVPPHIMKVFKMTGFQNVLEIEE